MLDMDHDLVDPKTQADFSTLDLNEQLRRQNDYEIKKAAKDLIN